MYISTLDDYTTDSIEERLQNMRLHIPDTGYISQNGTRRPQTAVLEHKPEMEPRHHVNRPHSAHVCCSKNRGEYKEIELLGVTCNFLIKVI